MANTQDEPHAASSNEMNRPYPRPRTRRQQQRQQQQRRQQQASPERRLGGAVHTAKRARVQGDRDQPSVGQSPQTRRAALSNHAASRSMSGSLCDVGERLVLSFLPLLPDRLKVEAVCKRWRALSRSELPIAEINFGRVVSCPSMNRNRVRGIISERGGDALRRLVLPKVALDDQCVQEISQQAQLRSLLAHRLTKRHLFKVIEACSNLQSLEVQECQWLVFSSWPQSAAPLRELILDACHSLRNAGLEAMIRRSGCELRKLVLTGAANITSDVLPVLAEHAKNLEELTLTHGASTRLEDLHALLREVCRFLRWLDLSSCSGVTRFPRSTQLSSLEVLLLDKTDICDDGIESIGEACLRLKYLSLQDCPRVTGQGIITMSSLPARDALELVDLKGTKVTDTAVHALESGCTHLRVLHLDSCRNVSRELRLLHGERARATILRGDLRQFDRISLRRYTTENADKDRSSSESDSDSNVSEDWQDQ